MKKKVFNIIQIGDKSNRLSRLFDIFIAIVICANILVTFLQTFDELAFLFPVFHVIEVITILIFCVEYVLRIWTADYLYPDKNVAAAWHAALSPRGVTVRVLRQCPRTGAVLVYVYRPARVARLLAVPHMLDFLAGEGYTPGTADELLDQLAERLCCEGDFPHEIGVFLGYPLADVIGFIQNRGKNFTACGYWKVYTDPTAAQAEFDRYKKCERIYARCYYNGTPIRRLTVAA